jgi:hypothetical protein
VDGTSTKPKAEENKISTRSIDNSSQIILREEQQRRWKDPAFWGYSRRLKNQVIKYFKNDNDKFAKAAGGQAGRLHSQTTSNCYNERNKFINPNPLKKKKQCMLLPSIFYGEFATKSTQFFLSNCRSAGTNSELFITIDLASDNTVRKNHLLQLGKP